MLLRPSKKRRKPGPKLKRKEPKPAKPSPVKQKGRRRRARRQKKPEVEVSDSEEEESAELLEERTDEQSGRKEYCFLFKSNQEKKWVNMVEVRKSKKLTKEVQVLICFCCAVNLV